MPAAEPAPTGDVSGPPGAGDARIIPLNPRTARGRNGAATAHRHRGGADTMTQPAPPPAPDGGGEEAILRPLADMLEQAMVERHATLADPVVRAAFDVAMDTAVKTMGGAAAKGIVDDAQRAQLVALLEGARRAARIAATD